MRLDLTQILPDQSTESGRKSNVFWHKHNFNFIHFHLLFIPNLFLSLAVHSFSLTTANADVHHFSDQA
jgi:hypothetical protein